MKRSRATVAALLVTAVLSAAGAGYAGGRGSKDVTPSSDLVAVQLALEAMQASGRSMHQRMTQAAQLQAAQLMCIDRMAASAASTR